MVKQKRWGRKKEVKNERFVTWRLIAFSNPATSPLTTRFRVPFRFWWPKKSST
jgi:hypothetical protein